LKGQTVKSDLDAHLDLIISLVSMEVSHKVLQVVALANVQLDMREIIVRLQCLVLQDQIMLLVKTQELLLVQQELVLVLADLDIVGCIVKILLLVLWAEMVSLAKMEVSQLDFLEVVHVFAKQAILEITVKQ
jgi:hypothetical protein